MNAIGEDFSIQCRLCSSKSALISLFKGKNLQIRNYIRKLVEITTNIKYEEEDYFSCICYSCTVNVYNLYIFRIKSVENEEKLKKLAPNKVCHHRKHSIKLQDIHLKDDIKLKNVFSSWMQNKFESYSSDSYSSSKVSSKDSEAVITFVDSYVQTEPPCQNSKYIQTVCKSTVSSIHTQTEETNFSDKKETCDISSQTVNTALDKNVQCNIISNPTLNTTLDKNVQCDIETLVLEKGLNSEINQILKISSSDESFRCPSPQLFEASIPLSPTATQGSELLEITRTFVDLYSCEECDAILYSQTELQNHKKNHMKCKFCHKKFRTIEQTKVHFDECKKTVDVSQPYVSLERIEASIKTEKRYSPPPKKKSKTSTVVTKKTKKKK